uniref:TRAP transporter large permease subunit n=1 Tax=candidate division WOR-3 bacterium TaxID=2052148 RepID=A0A7C2P0Q5_UNCW3
MERLKRAVVEAVRINGFVLFVVVSATYFTYLVASSDLGKAIAEFVVQRGLLKMKFMIIVNVIYLIMGCFMDNIAILLLTILMFAPTIKALQIDLVWFGIVAVVNV